jgi:hypothetical protein
MTTPYPDDPSATNPQAAGSSDIGTPPGGGPAVGADERVQSSRLAVWLAVFAVILVGLVLYLIFAGRLTPLLG